jgi:deoxyribodipyrimidine photolyase-related protein
MGGEWNYDKENRKKIPATLPIPPRTQFEPDEITLEVAEMARAYFPDSFGYEHLFGAVLRSFPFGVTREQALEHLDEFLEQRLDLFGPYEDALKTGEDTLFHSVLSVYLNNGLLHPREVCEKALGRFDEGHARLESVEGFIRQILGWREFIRIYYEAMMPKIREANHFGFERGLPALYWSGNTEMHCLRESVRPVLEMAYSHHIQRLMILSNFSNLTETDPRELNRWFHLAYADAYEWVELPNVLGMSTFADGGILASKPYVSGGNYINKMSDYCRSCRYDVKQKTGEGACPFNVLYWNFVDRQRETYNQSGRVNFMVSMFDKKPEEEKQAIREEAERFISAIHRLEPCARAEE